VYFDGLFVTAHAYAHAAAVHVAFAHLELHFVLRACSPGLRRPQVAHAIRFLSACRHTCRFSSRNSDEWLHVQHHMFLGGTCKLGFPRNETHGGWDQVATIISVMWAACLNSIAMCGAWAHESAGESNKQVMIRSEHASGTRTLSNC
jgi:hypothetical protein